MLSELYFMKKTFRNIFFLLIIFIQLSSTESNPNKCYSILNCEKCPELDYCEKCLDGFIMNNPKTKWIGKETQNNENTKKNIQINENIKQINNNNNINQKKSSSNQNPTKKSIDPFQNIPFKSIQQAKKSDLNRARINRLLIIIIIILAISIIISAAYDFIKKMMNNNHEEYDTQEESTKVVIR